MGSAEQMDGLALQAADRMEGIGGVKNNRRVAGKNLSPTRHLPEGFEPARVLDSLLT